MSSASSVALLTACLLNGSCKTHTMPDTNIQQLSSNQFSLYETVNSRPQLFVDANQLHFYWGLWRQLSPAELRDIENSPSKSAALISRRKVSWILEECSSGNLLHNNAEEFYYLDTLELEGGTLRPLPEAARHGWRYFSLGSFNSALAREDSNVPNLVRKPNESGREFRNRKHEAMLQWLQNQSRRGQRGKVFLESEHKFFDIDPESIKASFVQFEDYRANDDVAFGGQFAKFNPSRWPIFYDERAHKPHSFTAPQVWTTYSSSVHLIRANLVWDWCQDSESPIARFEIDPRDLPPPGPNRPGRSDGGNRDLPIVAPQN